MCHTHTHTHTHTHITLVFVCDILYEVNISLTSTTWMNHVRLNVSYSFSSTTSRTSKKFGEYWTLLSPEILSYVCYLKINDTIMLPLVSCGPELGLSH
jgi:hypothetical protein